MFATNRSARIVLAAVCSMFIISSFCYASTLLDPKKDKTAPEASPIEISGDMGDDMRREATKVREEIEVHARSLFERTPLWWNRDTIDYIYQWSLGLPGKIPVLWDHFVEQSRLLGAVGSLIILAFLAAVIYSAVGQKKVLRHLEKWVELLKEWIPEDLYPYVLSALKVVVASLIPLLLFGAFSLISAFIQFEVPWFVLTGKLLKLWVVGALLVYLLRESLTQDLLPIPSKYGKTIFSISRIALFYLLGCVAVLWAAEVFQVRADVLALIKFAISLSIVFVLLLIIIRKKAILFLLPDLPYKYYQTFTTGLDRFYFPVMFLTFLTGLLWCFGYQRLCKILWTKTWAVAGTFVAIMLTHHILQGWLQKWADKTELRHEQAEFLYRSIKALLLYAMIFATIFVTLLLLGFLDPLERMMSFPVIKIGETVVSFWIILKAVLILVAFIYVTRLLQAFLDYKIYPAIGVDAGLAYALNTFLGYLGIVIGVFVALKIIGIDLRVLMVFAGAIGIGIGLGLQSMAANVISGFSLIFGRKLRKDDWIQVGDTLGQVTDIFMRATKVRTRDNIEYLIPNSNFINKNVINYTLSSPTIRVHIPVRASYNADPEVVCKILLECVQARSEAIRHKEPEIRIVEYGESSIKFELLVWMDVREIEIDQLRSDLYFTIFKALKEAGIEIPYPQRDLHIRTAAAPSA
ncbi:mechanosensitive ion channel family protein [Thermodesulfobacteriota bacterium]